MSIAAQYGVVAMVAVIVVVVDVLAFAGGWWLAGFIERRRRDQ